jgi:hypothetical protein
MAIFGSLFMFVSRYSFSTVYHSYTEEVPSQSQSAMVPSQVQWVCRISIGPPPAVSCFLEPAGVIQLALGRA